MSFAELALAPELKQALQTLGYATATPVQAMSLPVMLQGQDVLAQARTGSGKTAAFGLALLSALQTETASLQGLVLCPTRELADQVAKEIRALARFTPNIKVLSLCGGVPVRTQLASLGHEPHIVVGTPGRLQDLIRRKALRLENLSSVVLDEADRMLDMGFIEAISEILEGAPDRHRTWLFSATYPPEIRAISTRFQRNPVPITLAEEHTQSSIQQRFFKVERADKLSALHSLLIHESPDACLIFCNTREDTKAVTAQLQNSGFSALALHGDLDQRKRDETMVQFANGSCPILVATDVAARGLDIKGLPMVIAYELPADPTAHIHRVGRTGRAGQSGLACSLVAGRELTRVQAIEKLTGSELGWNQLPNIGAHRDTPRARMTTLVMDAGRKDKLRPGDILGALTGSGGLQGAQVGKIDVFATRSYVAIASDSAKMAMANLQNAKIKGRKIRVRKLGL